MFDLTIDLKEYQGSLKHKAFDVGNSRGREKNRDKDEDSCYYDVLSPFQLDIEKIRRSKGLRRLQKTQVFANPKIHVRTRRVHTDEVMGIAGDIARILGLNVVLCEAIAFLHDIGHLPFGHLCEHTLTKISGKKIRHEILSVIIPRKIERSGDGLNLSFEVLEGALLHSRDKGLLSVDKRYPMEYAVVMFADKIAYLIADINDAPRCKIVSVSDFPAEVAFLGNNQRQREYNCVSALVKESSEKGFISFSESEIAIQFEQLRQWMYKNVYKIIDQPIQTVAIEQAFEYFKKPDFEGVDPALFIALLTDQELISVADSFLRSSEPDLDDLKDFGAMEILPYLRDIDITNPGLDW